MTTDIREGLALALVNSDRARRNWPAARWKDFDESTQRDYLANADCALAFIRAHDGHAEAENAALTKQNAQLRLHLPYDWDKYQASQESIREHMQLLAAEKAARERAEQELANFGDRISAAIGTNDYLDPPDGGGPELAEQVRRMRTEVVRLKEIAVLSRRFMRANWCTAEYYQLQRELLDKLRAALGGLNG